MTSEETSTDISNYFESICYANAVKEQKNEKIGLVVKRSNAWNTLYISGIKDTSKFANSKLEIGMVILTINGMKCPTTVKEIQKVMKETEGDLTIMAASISKEITISGSDASSPVQTPSHSPVRPSNGMTSVRDGSPELPLHPNKSKDDTETTIATAAEPQRVEMTLSGHDTTTTTANQNKPRPVSPPDSPGSSPISQEERKVSDSGERNSPVSICTIDFAGNIVVTPKGSPKNTVPKEVQSEVERKVQMPMLNARTTNNSNDCDDAREEEKKEEPDRSTDDQSSKSSLEEAASETSRQSASTEAPEEDTKLPASSAAAAAAPERISTKQQQRDEADEKAKYRGRGPRMAPAVAPGAYHVASRPSVGSKTVRSLSPAPTNAQTVQDRRTTQVRPGAHRVSGVNARYSEPSIAPLSSGALSNTSDSARAQRTIGMSSKPNDTTGSNSARAQRTIGGIESSPASPAAAARIRRENMPPPHPDLPQPGARRMAGPNARRPSGDSTNRRSPPPLSSSLPSKQGYVPASAASPAGASVYSGSRPVNIDDDLEEEELLQGIGVATGVPVDENRSVESSSLWPSHSKDASIDFDYSKDNDDDQFSQGSIEISEAPEMSVITSDDLVVAAEVQEHPEILEDRIRKQILQETAQAAVVMVEHGGSAAGSDSFYHEEEVEEHRHKNVKEKLFGDGGKGRDVTQELSVAPDRYIRKRVYLPWSVQQNMTTNMWIATIVTDQKAYDEDNKKEQDRSKAVFSAKTEREAHETGLAMATPYLQPFQNHPICDMCSSKFAVFSRPHNCRNCGVVVCSKCTVIWSSKRFPSTYQTSKSTHSVCLACDWSANNFQDAILQGNMEKAVKLYESGNVNLRTPYISSKKKSGEEIMYPVHMAFLGRNVELARWLCKERCAPVTTEVKTKGNLKSLPIGTSKSRTPLKLAIKQKDHDMLKFLVAEMNVSLFDEDIKADYRWILAHLSNTLHRAPYEHEIADNKKRHADGSSHSQVSSPSSPHSLDARAYAGSGGMTVATHGSHGSSRAGSRPDSRTDSLAEV